MNELHIEMKVKFFSVDVKLFPNKIEDLPHIKEVDHALD